MPITAVLCLRGVTAAIMVATSNSSGSHDFLVPLKLCVNIYNSILLVGGG